MASERPLAMIGDKKKMRPRMHSLALLFCACASISIGRHNEYCTFQLTACRVQHRMCKSHLNERFAVDSSQNSIHIKIRRHESREWCAEINIILFDFLWIIVFFAFFRFVFFFDFDRISNCRHKSETIIEREREKWKRSYVTVSVVIAQKF